MPRPAFALLLALALPSAAAAQCHGTDLRASLTAEEQAEQQAALDGLPYATGNHWLAEKDDEVIHLIGTIHLGDARLGPVVTRLAPVIEAAGLLLLEADTAAKARLEQRMATEPGLLTLTGATLPEVLPEADWQRLAEAARSRGIPAVMAAKFQPWMLSMLLATPACAMDLLQADGGLDAQLQDLADTAKVPTRALEPVDTIFNVFNAEPLEVQAQMLVASLPDQDTGADQIVTTINAYFDEANAEAWTLSRVIAQRGATDSAALDAAFDAMETQLLTNRNRAWIPVILQAAATTEAPVVAAFGAAHLFGEDGVANLLAAEGYSLRRLPF